jgi:NADH:ubiquinone reductase (H+-translocating)
MSTAVLVILWLAVTCYVVFGGADYGAGFWELLAGGKRGARARALIDHSMGPVWEANNVWLVFAMIVLWTAFPKAFASIMSTLYLPLGLAALGIVLRGSCFVFHKATKALTGRRLFGIVFGLASLVTPFFLGTVFGSIASGRVPVGRTGGDPIGSWLNPTSLLVGVLAVISGAFLAAVFLVFDARRALDDTLERYFRQRALISGIAAGAVALLGLFVVRKDAPFVAHGLLREGLPLVLVSAACGAAALLLLAKNVARYTRALAVAAVAAVVSGWGAAQYPYLIPTSLTVDEAAGAPHTLTWVFVVFLIAAVTAVPALVLLFVLDQRGRLMEGACVVGQSERPRVVVVGGGFGGLLAARALGWSPVDVTLIDRQPHHLFQPLLYQVATGILSDSNIAPLLRRVLKHQCNAAVVLAEVTGFDLERRLVRATRPDGETITIPYDSLIVAAGAHQTYFGHDEFARFAPGMKTLDDALRLRRRLLQAFELAELCENEQERQSWLTVAIVGAGPTGVEIAGQVHALAARGLGSGFRRIDVDRIRVVLLDAGCEPLVHFGDKLSKAASDELTDLGVELRMNTRVTHLDATGVEVQGPDGAERIEARTVVWAAGVQASPLAGMLAEASGSKCDHAGRVEVQDDCTLPNHPEVFAIGDMVSLGGLPGVAEVAMQQGFHAARLIRRRIAGEPAEIPFRYRDLGSMATVGHFRAVVSFKGLHLSGFPAWVTWLVVHITFLTGFGNRLAVIPRWMRNFAGQRSQLAFSSSFAPASSERGSGFPIGEEAARRV